MGLGNISGALSKLADRAADVAAGAIAGAVVATHGGVPKKMLDRAMRESKPAEASAAAGSLGWILAEFAASSPEVDIRRLLPVAAPRPRPA